jgi:hypothetical protein
MMSHPRHCPTFRLKIAISLCAFLSFRAVAADSAKPELQPAFPNYALRVQPTVAGRLNPAGVPDTEEPFGWTQYVVVREGAQSLRTIGGFDPGFQPVIISLIPSETINIKVDGFDPDSGIIGVTALTKKAGQLETFLYQVRAREILNSEHFNLIYDITSI